MRVPALPSLHRLAIALATGVAALALCASAEAETIGELSPLDPEVSCGTRKPYGVMPVGQAATRYAAPAAGTITTWSTTAGTAEAAVGEDQIVVFKVYRPLGGESFMVVGHDGPRTLDPGLLNSFQTSIPVQAGDVIGTVTLPFRSPCVFGSSDPKDVAAIVNGGADDGTTVAPEFFEDQVRVNVGATFLPGPPVDMPPIGPPPPRAPPPGTPAIGAPAIDSLAPTAGPVTGGSEVIVTGSNFAAVKSVAFGGVPASSFRVDSKSRIAAISPPSTKLTQASVVVTTAAGSATAPQAFAYEGCLVPGLKGKRLKPAKKRLRGSGCRIGRVKRARGVTVKTGRVARQSRKPGTLLAPGAKVKLTLSARG
jgi:hypothetical protein